jgi:hypothetical protein
MRVTLSVVVDARVEVKAFIEKKTFQTCVNEKKMKYWMMLFSVSVFDTVSKGYTPINPPEKTV